MNYWGQVFVNLLGVAVPIILYLARSNSQAKKDEQKRHEELKKQEQTRHEEYKAMLDELFGERKYLKPHDHIEMRGPLTAEGVIRKRNGS